MSKGKTNASTTKVMAEFSVSSLVSILLDGLEATTDVVRHLERDSALDGRTREELRSSFERLARLVVEAEVFRTTLQLRLNNLAQGSAQVQRLSSVALHRYVNAGNVSRETDGQVEP